MTIEIEPEKEYFLKGNEQCKELLMRHKENQKWIYYVIIGSLSLITILNFMIPNFHWIKPDPINIKLGFVGVILVFFGSVFFFRAFIQSVAEKLVRPILVDMCHTNHSFILLWFTHTFWLISWLGTIMNLSTGY